MLATDHITVSGSSIAFGDFLDVSRQWPTPTAVVCDGPYGVDSFPGDPRTHVGLDDWYRPHLARITEAADCTTTLWFWNTEIGWATVHPVIAQHGWIYRSANIWDKGIAHIAGNSNTQTLRGFPVVTELCVQYTRTPVITRRDGSSVTLQEWMRAEWLRTGLPLNDANRACGVKNAATRKYLTTCDLWYMPPGEIYDLLVAYANRHGDPAGQPYFDHAQAQNLRFPDYERIRAKFHCPTGVTNVWRHPTVPPAQRARVRPDGHHPNQKPVALLEQIIQASTDPQDVVWDPFCGVASVAIAAVNTQRRSYSSEINPQYFDAARRRLSTVQYRLL